MKNIFKLREMNRTEFSFLAIWIVMVFGFLVQNVHASDEYGYVGDQVYKEIYEVYDELEVLGDEYLPINEWDNPELEKGCMKNLTAFYSDEKNAPAKVKVLKVYLNYPKWKNYTKVSSDAYDGVPTHRRTFCSYVLQKDTDKFIIVWSKQVYATCTNYDKKSLKPISYSEPSVTTLNATEWEEWGKATAFKLTKEQVAKLGILPGKNTKSTVDKDKSKLSLMMEYTAGYPSKAKIQAKSKTHTLVLWDEGDFVTLTNEEFESALNSIPTPERLQVGAKVSAQWTNGSFYTGKIIAINGKAYTIGWDDGSDPIDVTIDQIRMLK